jgi:spore maturation protein CgeB
MSDESLDLDNIKVQPKKTIVVVGDFTWPWYEPVCADALETLGHRVYRFRYFENFFYWKEGLTEPLHNSFWSRLQNRFSIGPLIYKINNQLLSRCAELKPDIVWIYNSRFIYPETIKKIRIFSPTTKFALYSNDNPFSLSAMPLFWWNFLRSIPEYDVHFCYRHSNFEDYRRYGADNIKLLRSYYIPQEDYHIESSKIPQRFICDVVFAGHFENDGRIEMLESICKKGYKVNIFGGGWDAALSELSIDSPLRSQYPIKPVTGEDYRYAICGAKVALCFLSTLNRDTYTRRSFQIPAMRVAMLSQYTEDLESLYVPNVEALFFKNNEELLNNLGLLISNDSMRESVALAGYKRVVSDGHDAKPRMKRWVDDVNSI